MKRFIVGATLTLTACHGPREQTRKDCMSSLSWARTWPDSQAVLARSFIGPLNSWSCADVVTATVPQVIEDTTGGRR